MERRKTVADIKAMKPAGEKIVMLTAYDYPSARIAEAAGVDMILVGDSLGMVVLLIPATIFGMKMGVAVLFHEGSTLLVVANALRLLAYRDPAGH